MHRDEALKQSDRALEELAVALEQGRSESLIQYLDLMSTFHHYSFRNCLLIALQKPDATLVAGFRRWKELKRYVKKGEKGIAILAPLVSRRRAEETADGEEAEAPPARALRGFKAVHVFDVSQTEGQELPEFATVKGEPGEKLERLEAIVRAQGIELVYEEIPGGALGLSQGGKIAVLPTLPKAETFSVLVHELAHELLHRGDRRQETTKTLRETEAEATAYVVCRASGLDCSTKSSDYVQLYGGDKDLLFQSLELIRDVAASILADLAGAPAKEAQDAA
jgi:antirestriction protein ArdC